MCAYLPSSAGCRLTWSHTEESADIDGIICVDWRWIFNLFRPDSPKYWPVVVTLVKQAADISLTFAMENENLREVWITHLVNVVLYSQVVSQSHAQSLKTNTLEPAIVALKDAHVNANESETLKLVKLIGDTEAAIEDVRRRIGASCLVRNESRIDIGSQEVRVTKKSKSSKKRTFGKSRIPQTSAASAESEEHHDSSREGAAVHIIDSYGICASSESSVEVQAIQPDRLQQWSEFARTPTPPQTAPVPSAIQETRARRMPRPSKQIKIHEIETVLPEQVIEILPCAANSAYHPIVKSSDEDCALDLATGSGFKRFSSCRWTFECLDFGTATGFAVCDRPHFEAPPCPTMPSFSTESPALLRCF